MYLVGGPYLHAIGPQSSDRRPKCALSLSSYPVRYVEPTYTRRDFKEVKLGWLTAVILDGPRLVFRDADVVRAIQLRGLLHAARAIFWAGQGGMARVKTTAETERPRLVAAYKGGIRKLRSLNDSLVELSIGYTFPGGRDIFTREDACYLFDGDPLEPGNVAALERHYAPPAL